MTDDRFLEIWSGKSPLDIEKAKKIWLDMKNGIRPSLPSDLPHYTYPLYIEFYRNKKGRKFDKESFMLEWFENEFVLSEICLQTGYKGENLIETNRVDMMEYFKAWYSKELKNKRSQIIKKHFPDINPNPGRINLKIWRFKRSGILQKLDGEIARRIIGADPNYSKKIDAGKETWAEIKFAQRVGRFIQSRPGQKATQRELERHFSNKRKADLERAFEWLFFFPIIRRQKNGKTTIFSWSRLTAAEIAAYNQKVAE